MLKFLKLLIVFDGHGRKFAVAMYGALFTNDFQGLPFGFVHEDSFGQQFTK